MKGCIGERPRVKEKLGVSMPRESGRVVREKEGGGKVQATGFGSQEAWGKWEESRRR
jgi:hypothetical protein